MWLPTFILLIACLFKTSTASACSFRGLMAHCQMTIGGHHIDASARINKCHTPIDIYFLVTANNDRNPSAHNTDNTLRHRPLYWHYTYVTSNHPEMREMPGYGQTQRVQLHVDANTHNERGDCKQKIC